MPPPPITSDNSTQASPPPPLPETNNDEAVIISLGNSAATNNNDIIGYDSSGNIISESDIKEIVVIKAPQKPIEHLYDGRTGAQENSYRNQIWALMTPEERVEAQGLSATKLVDDGTGINNLYQEIGILSEAISEAKLNGLGVRHTFLGNRDFKQILFKHDGSYNQREGVTIKKSEFAQGFTLSQQLFQTLIIDPALKNVGNIELSFSNSNGRPRIAFTSDLGYNVGLENINKSGALVPTNKVTIVLEHLPEMGASSWRILTAHPGEIWSE